VTTGQIALQGGPTGGPSSSSRSAEMRAKTSSAVSLKGSTICVACAQLTTAWWLEAAFGILGHFAVHLPALL
jgi:hypothetical protein